ncbi:DUF4179 domain-containing protein [Paenibacillus sp. LMG 31459]|uniref:DUF4179 domain-containing protein n=1 Tax=Paenibacillus phytohabitans TaxID=2654978 RepID=A0ABX1YWE4_9BACL|nr:DUF4179 domain-containing protein [Paenibacillus phytohabitans]NOU83944.1 DUF4179 domain-containing protein [Paenibacillus phytohabitans]
MDRTEALLKRRLNDDNEILYPDFEEMWGRMEQAGHAGTVSRTDAGAPAPHRHRSWRKFTIAASLSALLVAVPVYAAVQYDWGILLRYRGGVQAALAQNLGQPLGQTITKDGVTLTLHTALTDENRTVILYSLDVGADRESGMWNIQGMSLKDAKGNGDEMEYNYQQWDEKNQRYNGYFESNWTPDQETVKVSLTAKRIESYSQQEVDLNLDTDSPQQQSFPVNRDGLESFSVQPFKEGNERLMLSTAAVFSNSEAKSLAFPQIIAYRDGELVSNSQAGAFGKPGDNGEYTSLQYYKPDDVPKADTVYKLGYTKLERNIDGPWTFDLELSKKKMADATIKTALDLPLEAGDTDNRIEQMVVTPTQIRVSVRSKAKFAELPYVKYALEVDGRKLEGGAWYSTTGDRDLTTLRFERPADLEITKTTSMTLIGKYKVTRHEDDKTPLQLTNISSEKQTLIRETGGIPVQWTYYMQGADLYVETKSDDPHFGGVNQTHIGTGKDRILGKIVTVNFRGEGNNHSIDVYKDFKGTEAAIYMFFYSTNEPNKETRVQLQP